MHFKYDFFKTGLDISTFQDYWKNLPNWHKASKSGFPMYRVTNITYMEVVRHGGNAANIIFNKC